MLGHGVRLGAGPSGIAGVDDAINPSPNIVGNIQRSIRPDCESRSADARRLPESSIAPAKPSAKISQVARGMIAIQRLKHNVVSALRVGRPVPRTVKGNEDAVAVAGRELFPIVVSHGIRSPMSRKCSGRSQSCSHRHPPFSRRRRRTRGQARVFSERRRNSTRASHSRRRTSTAPPPQPAAWLLLRLCRDPANSNAADLVHVASQTVGHDRNAKPSAIANARRITTLREKISGSFCSRQSARCRHGSQALCTDFTRNFRLPVFRLAGIGRGSQRRIAYDPSEVMKKGCMG